MPHRLTVERGKITIRGGSGKISPVAVILQPGYDSTDMLDKAASLIRDLTGTDPGAWVDEHGTTIVYASSAPAYPDERR